jgi:hypothetical protein
VSFKAAVTLTLLHPFGPLPFTEISLFAPFGAGILPPVHLTEAQIVNPRVSQPIMKTTRPFL